MSPKSASNSVTKSSSAASSASKSVKPPPKREEIQNTKGVRKDALHAFRSVPFPVHSLLTRTHHCVRDSAGHSRRGPEIVPAPQFQPSAYESDDRNHNLRWGISARAAPRVFLLCLQCVVVPDCPRQSDDP